jgi:putative membrane protein
MKSKIAQATVILASAGLLLSAPALFAIDGAGPNQPLSAQPAANSDLNATDPTMFVEAAHNINSTEIEMGRLANERGQSESVRKLGQRMVRDHTMLENRLKALAGAKDIVLSSQLDARHQQMIDELTTYSGAAFDQHYLGCQVNGHQKAIALFQQVAAENQDRSVREFAANTLPILQRHLQLAEKYSNIINEPAGTGR